MRKRIRSLLLAAVMLFTLVAPAFAQSIALSADKTSVKAGEDVTVTASFGEALEHVTTAQIELYFNSTLFDYKDGKSLDARATIVIGAEGTAPQQYKVINWIDMTGDGTIAAGPLATCTFTAKQDISDVSKADFTMKLNMDEMLMLPGHDKPDYPESKLSVSVLPASVSYAVSASASNPAVIVGEDVQVSVKVDGSATYNAYYMELTYNSDVLTYKSINTGAEVQDSSGTLKIAGYGADKACGADDIVLTFAAKSIGTAQVTVTSAKVDAKSNAAEKDAPAAAITSASVSVTVGGYPVTLPDAFTGAGTAAPGEDYTFTAKDSSKKYDFTGSTMNGEAAEIIDNGNGTYTVKNVTGALIIAAAEKAGKVKISLTNSTSANVFNLTDGQEVEAGKDFIFMVMDSTGKELVVTANGQVLTGIFQAGRYRYTIPAAQVTGTELKIAIAYKAAEQATISMTGDWSDVVNKSWGSSTAVDAGMSLTFMLTQQDGYTYAVTANGEALTGNARQGTNFVSYTVDGAKYVKSGETVTIHITKTANAPSYTVDASEYVKLEGKSIFLITVSGDVAEGKVPTYDGNQMYWSAKYNAGSGAYAWLVISDQALDQVKSDAAGKIQTAAGTQTAIAYNGDVNLTEHTDINDAQLVWNMYNAHYSDFQTVNVRKFLEADMTGDGTVNVADAAAITALLFK